MNKCVKTRKRELRVRRCEVKVTWEGGELRVVNCEGLEDEKEVRRIGSLGEWKVPLGWTDRRIMGKSGGWGRFGVYLLI